MLTNKKPRATEAAAVPPGPMPVPQPFEHTTAPLGPNHPLVTVGQDLKAPLSGQVEVVISLVHICVMWVVYLCVYA